MNVSDLAALSQLQQLSKAQELSAFHTQPLQMPAGAKGKFGRLILKFNYQANLDRTELHSLYRQAPLLVQRALYHDEAMPNMPVCNIVSVGGGMLQGDRNQIEIEVDENASAHITTQGATRIQQMDANYASQYQKITLNKNAYLEYLPDITIPYKNSRYISHTDIYIEESATLLFGEIFMGGRKHHNSEHFEFDLLSVRNQVFSLSEQLKFSEKMLYQNDDIRLKSPAVMANYHVFANIFLLTPAHIFSHIKNAFPCSFTPECAYGLSLLPNDVGLTLRIVGQESHQVKAVVKDFWQLVRQRVKQKPLSRMKMNSGFLI